MLSRRSFLGWMSALGASLGIGIRPRSASNVGVRAQSTSLDPAVVASLAAAVLPSELGEAGFTRVGREFSGWIGGYRVGAEVVHPYGSAELRKTGESPMNRWRGQLTTLDQQARQRHQRAFVDLNVAQRRDLVTAALAADRINRMPDPIGANHIALAVLSWYFSSPDATDRCYNARIGRNQCRPLVNAPRQPLPLAGNGNSSGIGREIGAAGS